MRHLHLTDPFELDVEAHVFWESLEELRRGGKGKDFNQSRSQKNDACLTCESDGKG